MRQLRGPGGGQAREITADIVIGRDAVDLQLDDSEASRRHAVVRPVPDGVEVEDLGSSNGTFLDGRRIEGKVILRRSAALRIGQTDLRIEIELPQLTQVRPTGAPAPSDLTAARPLQPEVTVMRPTQPTPAAPPGDARDKVATEGGDGKGDARGASTPAHGRNARKAVPAAAGGVLLLALIVVGVLLATGGSSKKTLAAAHTPCDKQFPRMIQDGFPEPKLVFSHSGVLNYTLRAATALISPNQQHDYKGFEYNGQLPGPTLVFCPGDRVKLDLQNRLPLPSNLHVHGLHVSPQGAGDNIFVDVKPLQDHHYSYQIPADQSPGAFWYHPHLHGYVDPELAGGLAGAIVVEGGLDKLMPNIPQRLIVIQGGKEVPPNNLPFLPVPGVPSSAIHPPPRPGPVELLVNGAQDPVAHIRPGELQRWRIFNATAERLLTLQLPGTTFQVLAQDGTTLRNMLPESVLHVAPGARVEVLVRGGSPGTATLSALPFRQCQKGCFDPFAGNLPNGRVSDKESLLTLVTAGSAVSDPLPAGPLSNPPDLRGRPVDVHRTIVLARVPHGQSAPFFPIDHRLFNPNRVDITMKLNSVEEWSIEDPATGPAYQSHSFHIHQNAFQVVSIDGKPVNYIDWQDDIIIHPGEVIKILIHPVDFTGKFVFHCHIAFHEDNGQMGTVQVLANPPPAQVNLNRVFYTHPVLTRSEFASLNLRGVSYHQYLLYCHLHGRSV